MIYEYICLKCGILQLEKKMSAPDCAKCPECGNKIERNWQGIAPAILFADRPIWTYREAKKYKTAKWKGKEFKIDPSKHGDLGSWNSPGELIKPKKST